MVGQAEAAASSMAAAASRNAPRSPVRAISSGATIEPMASDAMWIPSSAPNTRVSIRESVARCRSVVAVTSITTRPMPASASMVAAAGTLENRPIAARGRDHSSTPSPNGRASPRRPIRLTLRRRRPARRPQRSIQVADPGFAEGQHVQRQHHDEHVQRAPQDRGRAEHRQHGARLLLAQEHAEPIERLWQRGTPARDGPFQHLVALDRVDAAHQHGRHELNRAAPRNTVADPVKASPMPASAGPTSIEAVAMPPAATFAAVSSDGVREIDGRMAAWIGRVRVIDGLRRRHPGRRSRPARRPEAAGRSSHRRDLHEVGDQQGPLATHSVAEGGGQGRDHRRWRQLDQRGDAGLRGATPVEGVDQDGDPGRPFGQREADERQQHAPQRGVVEDGDDDGERGRQGWPRHRAIIARPRRAA